MKIETKATFDGVYYRALVESANSFRIQIIIFWVPEIDYSEILKYEVVANGYDASK